MTDADSVTGEVTLQAIGPIPPVELFAIFEQDQGGLSNDEGVAAVSLTLTLDIPVGLNSSICFTPIAIITLDDAMIGFLAPGRVCVCECVCMYVSTQA